MQPFITIGRNILALLDPKILLLLALLTRSLNFCIFEDTRSSANDERLEVITMIGNHWVERLCGLVAEGYVEIRILRCYKWGHFYQQVYYFANQSCSESNVVSIKMRNKDVKKCFVSDRINIKRSLKNVEETRFLFLV